MRFNACLIGLVFASSAGAQDVIRYDFAIRVLSNTVPSGDLSSIGVNEVGTFTLIALDDRTIFPSSPTTPTFQTHQVLDVSVSVGSFSSGAAEGAYPNTNEILGLLIDDNTPLGPSGPFYDSLLLLPQFASPEIGSAVFSLRRQNTSFAPTFLNGLDLPRSLDLSATAPGLFPELNIPSELAGGSVVFDIFDVTITVIPTPGTGALLALTGLAAMRRRR
jgi:uncharacterized protein (TIGR03382 family)